MAQIDETIVSRNEAGEVLFVQFLLDYGRYTLAFIRDPSQPRALREVSTIDWTRSRIDDGKSTIPEPLLTKARQRAYAIFFPKKKVPDQAPLFPTD